MPIQTVPRPPQLSGCFRTWSESYVDVVARTEYETGNMRSRRRFTGRNKIVNAEVTLPANQYQTFMNWFLVGQRQGAWATYVKTPEGNEEAFQWVEPPTIQWLPGAIAFTARVVMFQGDDY